MAVVFAASSPDAEEDADTQRLDAAEAKEEVTEVSDDLQDVVASEYARNDMWDNFEKLADAYKHENRRLAANNIKMSRDLDDSRMGIKFGQPITYKTVPNFVLRTDARPTDKPTTAAGCEVLCNSRASCKSYSFNHLTMVCLLSSAKLQYSVDAKMYLKKELGEGDPEHAYQIIPGLNGDNVPVAGVNSAQKPFSECKWECTQAHKDCTAFVYNDKTTTCINTGGSSGWSPDWTYMEKIRHDTATVERQVQGKENDFKEQVLAAWKGQNSVAVKREAVTYKEVQAKCKFSRTETGMYEKQAEHYHNQVRMHKAMVETMVVTASKVRNDLSRIQTLLNRAETSKLDATAEKELLTKQGERVTDVKQIKPIYDNIALQSSRLTEAENVIRDERRKFLVVDKKRKETSMKRKAKEAHIDRDSEEASINSAKAIMTKAIFKTRCSEMDRAMIKSKLKEEKEAAKIDAKVAEEAEKAALEKKKAAENANKAAEETKGAATDADLQKEAAKAGREADQAVAEAKMKTKDELKVVTKQDKLKLELKSAQTEKDKWQVKVNGAIKYLKAIESKRDAEADAEFEKNMNSPNDL